MADLAISVAEKLIEVLGSEVIKGVCQMWDYESELVELKETVSTIQKALLDADAKRELSYEEQEYISKLKDVVYDADDLFDETRTLAELNQLKSLNMVHKFAAKVSRIFSSHNQVVQAYKISRDVRDIKTKLDCIASDHKKFGFSVDYKPIVRRQDETCSYINVEVIVGREKDKEAIIDMLLAPSSNEDFYCLTIVGVGGLGKTTLAQLVFNDKKIQNEFHVHRHWVCVSDQGGVNFDVKMILCKLIELVTKKKQKMSSSMELVQNQFQECFRGKKYLIVLDDVWNEDRQKWVDLKKFLMMGDQGSKIVVTTRSEKTCDIIGKNQMYNLDGLSQEDSWSLFEISAFDKGEKEHELVEIGEKIVDRCYRNPLTIKVLGSLLYRQDISKWQSVERFGLAEINEGSDKIKSILKLSYNNLTPSLKICFTYCALFPKDFEFNKEMLIDLWIAQGYIMPLVGGQSVENIAEEYFLILMRRCFFQDVKKDKYGNVNSVKIHDLMHDVALEVGKDEICFVTSSESNLGEKIRHVNIIGNVCAKPLLCATKIRSYICGEMEEHYRVDKQVEKFTALRVLGLSYSGVHKSLFCSIDRLLLLRYLKLRNDNLKALPDSITRLHNLQTIILCCEKLRELPKDFCKLVNLRHLDVNECWELKGMPVGMDKLTKLRWLPYFIVGRNSTNVLKALQFLTEIKGNMCIRVIKSYNNMAEIENDKRESYLYSMKHLICLAIQFYNEGESCNSEVLLKNLEPHLNLKGLDLYLYKGTTIPWSPFSPQHHLIDICIQRCPNLKQILVLSKLPHLKSLKLWKLRSMEYMEDKMNIARDNGTKAVVTEFFPSLQSLEMKGMKKLQAWWKEKHLEIRLIFPSLSVFEIQDCPNFTSFTQSSNQQYIPEHELPCLQTLTIWDCPSLASNIICPTIESLYLENVGENLLITCANSQDDFVKLKSLSIDKTGYLNALSTDCLTDLHIICDEKIECLLEVKEAFQRCASTVRSLTISTCGNLRRLSGLEYLTALEKLELSHNEKLIICEEDEEPWKSLSKSLCKLNFYSLPNMKSLPKGMRHLTSLQSLRLYNFVNLEGGLPEWISCFSSLQYMLIWDCEGIKSFPEAMKDLTSLKELCLYICPHLEERCKKPDGVDFPKIQHISEINFDGIFHVDDEDLRPDDEDIYSDSDECVD